nr:hypothetical protein [uncultured Oscillibacter sp.]
MKNTCISHKPGDIVQLAGIDFVVLEDRGPFNGEGENHDLFILALEGQGESRFGDTNNYAESDLKGQVEGWLYRLTEKMAGDGRESDIDLIRTRTISLTTLDGYKGYGELEVKAAPLTLDEARRCAEFMPDPDTASWLATGWGGPEHYGAAYALLVGADGGWSYGGCSSAGYAIRPALVVSSSLFASTELDLSEVSTDDLLSELRRRIGAE